MIYLALFFGFLKVGCFSFGGAYGAIPLIRDVVLSQGWLTDDELTGMIAVSECTPGPIMVNLATYVGSSQAGLPGAVVATLAVILPSFLMILLIMAVWKRLLKKPYVQAVLSGLKPCMIGIILATGVSMVIHNLFSAGHKGGMDMQMAAMMAVLAFLMFGANRITGKNFSPIMLIAVAALLGVLFCGVQE